MEYSNLTIRKAIMLSNSDMSRRGAFIVVEGIDRSGKSTQCQLLKDKLISRYGVGCVELRRFPDRGSTSGAIIDQYLKFKSEIDDRTMHLWFAVNRSEAMPALEKILKSGRSIIVDRYAFSGVAYTMAKESSKLSRTWCMNADSGILKPDIVIFLDIPATLSSSRPEFGSERYENVEFQKKVRETFLTLKDKTWKTYDASMQKEALSSLIFNDVIREIELKGEAPLDLLWPTQQEYAELAIQP
ncbi:thymidylate kinase-domain-containing protein [Chytridium lagenaria]|nr:thymidylate kinase-domain-containing protein [Chytridium lagenaria]